MDKKGLVMSLVNCSLAPRYFDLALMPSAIRTIDVFLGPVNAINTGAAIVFIQFHSRSPQAGDVPLFAIIAPPGAALFVDIAHLGGGLRMPTAWVGVSSTHGTYTAVATTGTMQIMVN